MSQRALSRALYTSLTGLALCATAGSAPSARAAERPTVSIGDINVSVDASGTGDAVPELGRAVRDALNDELSRVTRLTTVNRSLIVSATLTRLSSQRRDERSSATATISLALRRADDQVIFAELRGRASVEETAGNLAALRRAALQGAVHGALARLPEAVQRSH